MIVHPFTIKLSKVRATYVSEFVESDTNCSDEHIMINEEGTVTTHLNTNIVSCELPYLSVLWVP